MDHVTELTLDLPTGFTEIIKKKLNKGMPTMTSTKAPSRVDRDRRMEELGLLLKYLGVKVP